MSSQHKDLETAVDRNKLEALVAKYIEIELRGMKFEAEKGLRIRKRAENLFRRFYFFESAERLMLLARGAVMEKARLGLSYPSVCVWWADSLSGAKGRMQRIWWSPPGGIYMCLSIYPELLPENVQFYNIGAAVSIAEVLQKQGIRAEIRWLTDVLVSGKKVAGLLAESFVTPGPRERYLLIGIGINVNQECFSGALRESATSLYLETGRKWPVYSLGSHILARTAINFSLLHDWESEAISMHVSQEEPKNDVLAAYKTLSETEGRLVVYGRDLEQESGITALVKGILPNGAIRLVLPDGSEMDADTGEIRYVD